jgi:hypothetical protein
MCECGIRVLFFGTSYVATPNGRVKRIAVELCFAGALAGVVIVASPHALAQDVAMKSPQFTAARVAERYLATRYPDFDTVQEPPVLKDKGNAWEVSYELPPGLIGGHSRRHHRQGDLERPASVS